MDDLCYVVQGTFFKYLFCKIAILKISYIIVIGKYLNAIPFILWKMIILIKKGASDEHYLCFSVIEALLYTENLIDWNPLATYYLVYSNKFRKNFKIFTQFHLKLFIGLGLNIMIFVSVFNLLDVICKHLSRSNGHYALNWYFWFQGSNENFFILPLNSL